MFTNIATVDEEKLCEDIRSLASELAEDGFTGLQVVSSRAGKAPCLVAIY